MKKLLTVLLCLLMVTSLFAAGTAEKSSKVVELDWCHWFPEQEQARFVTPAIERFEAENPNIKINSIYIQNVDYFKQLAVDIAANNESDLCTLDTGDGFSAYYNIRKGGAFLGLDDRIKGYVLDDGTKLEDVDLIYSAQIDGKTIALPWFTYAAPVTIYRKSALKQAGVDPSALLQWDSYYEAAKKLTRDLNGDGKIDVYGFAHQTEGSVLIRWWTLHWMWQAGGGIYPNEEGPYTPDRLIWNSPANIEATTYLYKMMKEAGPTGKYTVNDALQLFANGTVATMQATTWCFEVLENMMTADDYENDLGIIYFPNKGDVHPVNITWGNPVAISSNTKHPDEAFKFAAFLHGEFAQKLLVRVPVNKVAREAYAKENPYAAQTLNMVLEEELRMVPDIVEWRELDNIIHRSLEDAFLGTKSVKDALDWGQSEMVKVMTK
jgi:multiple sugar transport system substrate-binding protein